jgi:hypothetical protein
VCPASAHPAISSPKHNTDPPAVRVEFPPFRPSSAIIMPSPAPQWTGHKPNNVKTAGNQLQIASNLGGR